MENYQPFFFPIRDPYVSGYRFNTDKHPGTDYYSRSADDRLFSILSGKLSKKFKHPRGGNTIEVTNNFIDGRVVVVRYGHITDDSYSKAVVGRRVKGGDQVAVMGSTGYSFGKHCHIQVDMGNGWIDPELALENIRLVYENRRPYVEFHQVFNKKTPKDVDIANFIANGTNWAEEYKRVGNDKKCQI